MSSTAKENDHQHQHMDHDIRDMISTLTHHLTSLSKQSKDHHQHHHHKDAAGDHDGDDNGVRIITLAGENKGATMKAEKDEVMDNHGMEAEDENSISTHTNSNYQAVNNSILFGGSCTAEDPGVHIEIADFFDEDEEEEDHEEHEKKKKKDKKEKDKKKKKKSSKDESDGNKSE